MHLLERYATSCGVKIGKPYIYYSFFPLPFERYISFQPFSKYQSKNYDYWQEVIDIIIPYLNRNNINIVQIGLKDDKQFNNIYPTCGQTDVSQASYIIKNSILHFGADSFGAHIASGFDKKIAAIYSNNNVENVKPYWSKDEDCVLLKPDILNKKPSYSAGENPKNINKIKPEHIARSILDLLNIEYKNLPNTIWIGEDYVNKTFEIIPDKLINPNNIPIQNPIIRMDYSFNEHALSIFLEHKNCIIVTNKPINANILIKNKKNIAQILYEVDDNNDPQFVKKLKENGINYSLISYLSNENLNKYKINYMDLGLIVQKELSLKPKFDIKNQKNIFYISSRILISSEGQFSSRFDWINKNGKKVIDTDDFWKEADNFYIFSIDH
jgi:hypothetical protein